MCTCGTAVHMYYRNTHTTILTSRYLYGLQVYSMWCVQVPVRLIVNVPFSLLLDLHVYLYTHQVPVQVKPSHRSLRVKYLYQSRKYLVVPRPIHHTWYLYLVPLKPYRYLEPAG